MKKLVTTILICVILITLSGVARATTEGTINTETARIRSEASANSSIIELASLNEKVEIIEETGEWYKVKYNGKTGYVSASLVDVKGEAKKEDTKQEDEQESTKNDEENSDAGANEATSANDATSEIEEATATEKQTVDVKEAYTGNISKDVTIKILPTINSTNIASVKAQTEITVIEIVNNWCYIETSENLGWVRTDILADALAQEQTQEQEPENIETEKQETEQVTEEVASKQETSSTKTGYVNVDTVNVRKETNTSSEILASISKNTEVTILGEESNWYKVKVNGITGYIAEKYISDEKVAETTSRGSETTRESLNVKEETSQEAEQDDTASTSSAEKTTTSSNTSSSTSSTSSTTGSEIVEFAMQYLNYKYVSGGSSPSTGFDCSGFTTYVYKNFGISLSRTSTGQGSNGVSVSKSNLQLGDILIFNNSSNTAIGHVGIYIGNNEFIHAANPSSGVKITKLSDSYYSLRYVDARRVL